MSAGYAQNAAIKHRINKKIANLKRKYHQKDDKTPPKKQPKRATRPECPSDFVESILSEGVRTESPSDFVESSENVETDSCQNNKMRFLQPFGILHNNNDDSSNKRRHSTYATTNGNNHQIVTIIQPHNLSAQNETTTSYIDDDSHPNVTIRNNSVTFTKNHFNQNNRQTYKVVSNGHYVNEVDNLIRKTYQTNSGFIGNDVSSSPFLGNVTYQSQHGNIDEHSQINNANQTYNHHHNTITTNIICRENLTKLDLDTNIQHRIITRGGDCGSSPSICSESSPDDSFMDDEDVPSVSSSMCPSLASPEPEVKYPRGIINPNYPGFQHLAHTLAEHFVDHHFEQSDSDVSEFEVELKTSSDSDNGNDNDSSGDLDKIEEMLKGVFNSREPTAVEPNVKFESELFCHNASDRNKMKDKYDVLNETNDDLSVKEDSKVITPDTKRIFSTPDILIKSNSFEEHTDFTEINEQPDILKNVIASDVVISDEVANDDKCENYELFDRCEHSQWSITPIDIVGNFEQEVEREFGLIVSGYWSSSSDDEMCVSVKNEVDEIGRDKNNSMYDKMTDAVLSDAKEAINTIIGECAHDELKLNSENCSVTDATDAHPHETFCAERQRIVIKSSAHCIPTAIVKPKYQRTSYDDRQLPPVVSIDREKPWYDNCSANNNVNLTPYKKIQQFPHFERKHKKHQIVNGTGSEKEKFNSMLLCEKDMDSVSVAVVSPRKKDKMEQVDVYGNGDKGIKCPTLQNNHSNLSNNNSSINCSNNNNKVVYRKGNKVISVKDSGAKESLAFFDVYNIETALPVIDLEAIENHLKAAKEEERRKRNDREEIRRRLAMGSDYDYFGRTHSDRPTRKPSLHSRLQGGMNLQICFMNETASDNESPSSNSESCPKLSKSFTFSNNSVGNTYSKYNSADSHPYNSRPLSVNVRKDTTEKSSRPSSLQIGPKIGDNSTKDIDFFTKQARLQIEARMALSQAKDMAHMQMEIDRQKQKQSPITEIIRNSLEKVGIAIPEEKRRVSRLMLTDMNIAQLQVIVNEFHTQIERLNENLVQFLMERDDLHMSQDSMLVDIEDLTRYLLAKEQTTDKQNNQPAILTTPTQEIITKGHSVETTNRSQTQSNLLRITNLVKK